MDCAQIRKVLSEYLDGMLDMETRARVDQHLKSCPGCAAHLASLKATADFLRSMPQVAPTDAFLDEVHRRIDNAGTGWHGIDFRKRTAFALAGIAVVFIAIFTVSRAIYTRSEKLAMVGRQPELSRPETSVIGHLKSESKTEIRASGQKPVVAPEKKTEKMLTLKEKISEPNREGKNITEQQPTTPSANGGEKPGPVIAGKKPAGLPAKEEQPQLITAMEVGSKPAAQISAACAPADEQTAHETPVGLLAYKRASEVQKALPAGIEEDKELERIIVMIPVTLQSENEIRMADRQVAEVAGIASDAEKAENKQVRVSQIATEKRIMDATASNIAAAGGKILSEKQQQDTEILKAVIAEIPAENYPAFLKTQKKISMFELQTQTTRGQQQQKNLRLRIEFKLSR